MWGEEQAVEKAPQFRTRIGAPCKLYLWTLNVENVGGGRQPAPLGLAHARRIATSTPNQVTERSLTMRVSSLFVSAVSVALAAFTIAGCSSNGNSAAFAPLASAAASGHRSVSSSGTNLLAMTTIAKITPSRRAEHWKMGMMPNSPCSPWPMCQYFAYLDICGLCPDPELDLSIYEEERGRPIRSNVEYADRL